MSTKVIKSVEPIYSIWGNVTSIGESEAYVADTTDLDSLELKINNKITSLQDENSNLKKKMELLEDLVKTVSKENHSLKQTLLSEFDDHIEKGKEILWNTYEQITKELIK